MSREIGDIYEQQAEEICRALGYQVIRPEAGNQRAWDRLVNGKRLQIKKRCVEDSKQNNIRLVTSVTSSKAVYRSHDVDAFAIFWGECWYVIPSDVLADENGDIGNGLHMPKFAHYARRWDLLAGGRVEHDVQTVMF